MKKKKLNWLRIGLIILGLILFGMFCYMVGYIYGESKASELFQLHLQVMQIAERIPLSTP